MKSLRFTFARASSFGLVVACGGTTPAVTPEAPATTAIASPPDPASTAASAGIPKPTATTPPVGMRWIDRYRDVAIAGPLECCTATAKFDVWNLATGEITATMDGSANAAAAGPGRRATYCSPRVLVIDDDHARLVLDARSGKMLQRNKIAAGTPLDCRHFEKAADKE